MSHPKKELIEKKIAEFMKGKPVPSPQAEDNIGDDDMIPLNESAADIGEPTSQRLEVIYLTCDWKPKK